MSDRPQDELPSFYMDAARAVVGMHPFPSEEETGEAIEIVRRSILKAREEAFEEAAKVAEGLGGHMPSTDYMEGYLNATSRIASAIRQHSQKEER